MKKLLLLTTSMATPALVASTMILTMSAPAVAQDMFDWSGFYVGGGVGVVQSKGLDGIEYEGGGLLSGWTSSDGAFSGEIYDDVDGIFVGTLSTRPFTDPAADSYNLNLDSLNDWVTEANTESVDAFGTVFGGGQWHMPGSSLVLGGELRGSFGNFGSSYSDSWSDTVEDSGGADCDTNTRRCVGASTVISLLLSPNWSGPLIFPLTLVDSQDSLDIEGSVTQDGSMTFGTSFDKSLSALAKVGVAVNRALIYGVAGPTVADVTASTSASLTETGEITVSTEDGSVTYNGLKTYEWDGSVTENRVGFTFGAGVDFAVTDNVILRAEASYTSLGTIDVTGTSADTSSTYTVSQRIGSAQALAGVMFKF